MEEKDEDDEQTEAGSTGEGYELVGGVVPISELQPAMTLVKVSRRSKSRLKEKPKAQVSSRQVWFSTHKCSVPR
jgi:hypothetical protein